MGFGFRDLGLRNEERAEEEEEEEDDEEKEQEEEEEEDDEDKKKASAKVHFQKTCIAKFVLTQEEEGCPSW